MVGLCASYLKMYCAPSKEVPNPSFTSRHLFEAQVKPSNGKVTYTEALESLTCDSYELGPWFVHEQAENLCRSEKRQPKG